MSADENAVILERIEGLKALMEEKFAGLGKEVSLVFRGLKDDLENHLRYHRRCDSADEHEHAALHKRITDLVGELATLKGAGARSAQKVLRWVAYTVGGLLLAGLITMAVAGLVHTLEAVPTLGNAPATGPARP